MTARDLLNPQLVFYVRRMASTIHGTVLFFCESAAPCRRVNEHLFRRIYTIN